MRGKHYDDVLMRQAQANVDAYWKSMTHPKYKAYCKWSHNCQDYCSALRKEYKRLYKQLSKEQKNEVRRRIKELIKGVKEDEKKES